jgi:hypothetical protein
MSAAPHAIRRGAAWSTLCHAPGARVNSARAGMCARGENGVHLSAPLAARRGMPCAVPSRPYEPVAAPVWADRGRDTGRADRTCAHT